MKTLLRTCYRISAATLMSVIPAACMHTGMVGRDGTVHHDTPGLTSGVVAGDIKATLHVPPLQVGRLSVIMMKLSDARTDGPLSGATVFARVRAHHGKEPEGDGLHEIHESFRPGEFTLPYEPSEAGEIDVCFIVTAVGGQSLDPQISVERTQVVDQEEHDHGTGANSATLVIVGAALMGAMMVAMLVASSGMH